MSENELDLKPLIAELIATFALVYIGGLAFMANDAGGYGILAIAFAHFSVITIMIYFAAPISGAHINPAVTLGFMVTGKMETSTGINYIISQLIGSIMAAIFLLMTAGTNLLNVARGKSELGFPHLAPGYGAFQGILMELILTFFVVFVIWTVTVDKNISPSFFGFAIGGSYFFGILASIKLTGGALNPARVLGPAIVSLDFSNILVYIIGPILGAILAAYAFKALFLEE